MSFYKVNLRRGLPRRRSTRCDNWRNAKAHEIFPPQNLRHFLSVCLTLSLYITLICCNAVMRKTNNQGTCYLPQRKRATSAYASNRYDRGTLRNVPMMLKAVSLPRSEASKPATQARKTSADRRITKTKPRMNSTCRWGGTDFVARPPPLQSPKGITGAY